MMENSEGGSQSPPEPDDDYVTDEPLPSMAMDAPSLRKHSNEDDGDSRDEVFSGPPVEKQRRMDDSYSTEK